MNTTYSNFGDNRRNRTARRVNLQGRRLDFEAEVIRGRPFYVDVKKRLNFDGDDEPRACDYDGDEEDVLGGSFVRNTQISELNDSDIFSNNNTVEYMGESIPCHQPEAWSIENNIDDNDYYDVSNIEYKIDDNNDVSSENFIPLSVANEPIVITISDDEQVGSENFIPLSAPKEPDIITISDDDDDYSVSPRQVQSYPLQPVNPRYLHDVCILTMVYTTVHGDTYTSTYNYEDPIDMFELTAPSII